MIWGLLHGVAICLTHAAERAPWYRDRVPKLLKQLLVFCFVCFAWIFFRSANLQDAATVVTRMFTTGWEDPQFPLLALLLVLSVWFYQWLYESKGRGILEHPAVRVTLVVAMALYLLLVPGAGEQAFIYFQF